MCSCGKEMVAQWKVDAVITDNTGRMHCSMFDAVRQLEPWIRERLVRWFRPERLLDDDEEGRQRAQKIMYDIGAVPFNVLVQIQLGGNIPRANVVIRRIAPAVQMLSADQPYPEVRAPRESMERIPAACIHETGPSLRA